MRLLKHVRALDAFQKVESDLKDTTALGGLVTVTCVLLAAVLAVGEVWDYLSPATAHSFSVDQEIQRMVNINIDWPYLWNAIVRPSSFRVNRLISVWMSELSLNVHDSSGDAIHQLARNTLTLVEDDFQSLVSSGVWDAFTPTESRRAGCRILGSLEVNRIEGNLHITTNYFDHSRAMPSCN